MWIRNQYTHTHTELNTHYKNTQKSCALYINTGGCCLCHWCPCVQIIALKPSCQTESHSKRIHETKAEKDNHAILQWYTPTPPKQPPLCTQNRIRLNKQSWNWIWKRKPHHSFQLYTLTHSHKCTHLHKEIRVHFPLSHLARCRIWSWVGLKARRWRNKEKTRAYSLYSSPICNRKLTFKQNWGQQGSHQTPQKQRSHGMESMGANLIYIIVQINH